MRHFKLNTNRMATLAVGIPSHRAVRQSDSQIATMSAALEHFLQVNSAAQQFPEN